MGPRALLGGLGGRGDARWAVEWGALCDPGVSAGVCFPAGWGGGGRDPSRWGLRRARGRLRASRGPARARAPCARPPGPQGLSGDLSLAGRGAGAAPCARGSGGGGGGGSRAA